MDREIASAAHTVILTAEEVVPPEAIAAHPDRTIVPHFTVDAVVEVPYGSFPHECYGQYDASFEHFQEYVDLVDAEGVEGVRRYLTQYVDEAGSFEGFLDRFGASTLERQRQLARELVPR